MTGKAPENERDDEILDETTEPTPTPAEGEPLSPTPTPAEAETVEAESVGQELAALDDAAELTDAADDEATDPVVESAAAETASGVPEVPLAPTAAESPPVTSGGNSGAAAGAPRPNRPYFGPITELNDLPPHVLEHLDDDSAAKLKAALDHPDHPDAGILVGTSIQAHYQSLPRAPGTDYEAPWYPDPLPPLRIELVLSQYDLMMEDVIDRAARRIDRRTDEKLDGRIDGFMGQIRSEIRAATR